MKKKSIVLDVIITIIFTAPVLLAQEVTPQTSDQKDLAKFGIGLHVEQFKIQNLISSTFVPINRLIFSISPNNKLRIEPAIGYTKAKETNKDSFGKQESTMSGIFFGVGLFGMYQPGKTNIYYGLRTEYGTIKDEFRSSDINGNSFTSTSKTNRFMIGPVVGAEFFFSKHFSFGGEVALKNYSSNTERTDTNNPTIDPDDENKNNFFSTETGLLLRFYF